MRLTAAGVLLTLTASLLPGVAHAATPERVTAPSASAPGAAKAPKLRVRTFARDLDHPWDVKSIGGGRFLVTERDRADVVLVGPEGGTRTLDFPSGSVWVSGETGLMGLEVDPDFVENRRVYTCQGATSESGNEVRVVRWTLDEDLTGLTLDQVLLSGIDATSGRHGGCRLLLTDAGSLLVGTGDAARGTNPQNKRSLAGKTLRLDPETGRPWPGNPWAKKSGKRRYVLTYGHRNVQGLAQRKNGTLWSVEHGTYRDDEVNLLRKGGDYGWNPVPGYNEERPMTDRSLPGKQRAARWRSGTPTIATSGASFVRGKQWGAYRGALAVAALGGERLVLMRFSSDGTLRRTWTPKALRGNRLRTVEQAPDGALLVTTDNGSGADRILRVTPR